jgi:hypothetical protein
MKSSAKLLKNVSVTLAIIAMTAVPTYAAGDEEVVEKKIVEKEVCTTDYQGKTECKIEKKEEVVTREEQEQVHGTVDAGIEDINFLGLAGVLAGTGAVFYLFSKLTQKVYILD